MNANCIPVPFFPDPNSPSTSLQEGKGSKKEGSAVQLIWFPGQHLMWQQLNSTAATQRQVQRTPFLQNYSCRRKRYLFLFSPFALTLKKSLTGNTCFIAHFFWVPLAKRSKGSANRRPLEKNHLLPGLGEHRGLWWVRARLCLS